jgi:hypothetical protein
VLSWNWASHIIQLELLVVLVVQELGLFLGDLGNVDWGFISPVAIFDRLVLSHRSTFCRVDGGIHIDPISRRW